MDERFLEMIKEMPENDEESSYGGSVRLRFSMKRKPSGRSQIVLPKQLLIPPNMPRVDEDQSENNASPISKLGLRI